MEGFYEDVAQCYRDEIRQLGAAGCRYLQLDDTNLAYLCDPKMREGAKKIGEDPDILPSLYASLINECIKDRPANMAVCTHLCRGNFASAWVAEGGYDPVAEVLFNELKVDGYFLEFDSPRAGNFAPLQHVRKGQTVVLGLMTTKTGALESKDDLKRRIDEAAKFVSLDQLCLSPQCGFASTEEGNTLTEDEQWAKLSRLVEVARSHGAPGERVRQQGLDHLGVEDRALARAEPQQREVVRGPREDPVAVGLAQGLGLESLDREQRDQAYHRAHLERRDLAARQVQGVVEELVVLVPQADPGLA